jgi:transposase
MPKPTKLDKLFNKWYDDTYDLVFDMHTLAQIPKTEIRAILGFNLRRVIDEVFEKNFE